MTFSSTLTIEQAQDEVFDCVVIGSGPAGSAAAFYLAQAGLRVLAVDKARFPREKACGDAVMMGSLAELKRLALLAVVEQRYRALHTIVINYAGQRFPAPLAASAGSADELAGCYLVPRSEFDALLLEHALKAGAQWLDAATVQRIAYQYPLGSVAEDCAGDEVAHAGEVSVGMGEAYRDEENVDEGEARVAAQKDVSPELVVISGVRAGVPFRLRARVVFVASGAAGRIPLESSSRLEESQPYLLPANDASRQVALRAYFDYRPLAQELSDALCFYFDQQGRYHYIWIFPDEDRANVGIIATYAQSRRCNLKALLLEELSTGLSTRTGLGQQRTDWLAAPLATGLHGSPLIADRVLYGGDAAALVDPNTGEGIAAALWSARIASETILRVRSRADYSRAALIPYADALVAYAHKQRFAEKLLLPPGHPAFM